MKEALDFLKKLNKNNNRDWFHTHKVVYDCVRKQMVDQVGDLIAKISKFDASIKHLDASKSLFRINRDVRFSRNKNPYKTNFGAFLSPQGKKAEGAGYYFHLEPGKSFVAGGMYMPSPEALAKVRQEIDYNLDTFNNILSNRTFKNNFGGLRKIDMLVNAPKGYPKDHPGVEHLRHKSFIVSRKVEDRDLAKGNFSSNAASLFKCMHPFLVFLRSGTD